MLLIGLGNPGKKYENTRHNAGHIFVRWLQSQPSTINHLQSTVFMNESGIFVRKMLKQCNLSPNQLILAHDDLDLPLGEFKLQFGRGSAGHNGVESTIKSLGTKDFWRLRFGIGRPPEGVGVERYVLENFSGEQIFSLYESFPAAVESLKELFKNSISVSNPN